MPSSCAACVRLPRVCSQLAQDQLALHVLEGQVPAHGLGAASVASISSARPRISSSRPVAGAHDHRPLDHVLQLAHVAGPVQAIRPCIARFADRSSAACRSRRRSSGRSGWPAAGCRPCAGAAGTMRRGITLRRKYRSSRKLRAWISSLQVAVGGGDDADVGLGRVLGAQPHELALLQHPQQLGLHGEGHLADLVQQQGAAVGQFELALAGLHRAGEGAALVAEEFGLQQRLGDRRAVDADEGPVARGSRPRGWRGRPLPCRCRSRPAAGPCRGSRRSWRSSRAAGPSPGCCPAGRAVSLRTRTLRRSGRFSLRRLLELEGPVQHVLQLVQAERLGQVVEGAAPGGLDRLLDGAEGRHHDHQRVVVQVRRRISSSRSRPPRPGIWTSDSTRSKRSVLAARPGPRAPWRRCPPGSGRRGWPPGSPAWSARRRRPGCCACSPSFAFPRSGPGGPCPPPRPPRG